MQTEFYEQFNVIKKATDVPDASNIAPTDVSSIIVSSGIEENKKLRKKIGFKLTARAADYEYHTLFKKKDKSTIYALRLQRGNDNCISLLLRAMMLALPAVPPDKGFMDSDCFDSDDSTYTLKTNMATGFIPPYYICGDSNIVDPNCLCGGTKVGALCENHSQKTNATAPR